jgi:hypothetical protein
MLVIVLSSSYVMGLTLILKDIIRVKVEFLGC